MRLMPLVAAALAIGAFAPLPLVGVTGAAAQIKPMHSGHMAHGAPQMRRHGSGLHHPNRPKHHHFHGHHGYRPTHHHRHHHHGY